MDFTTADYDILTLSTDSDRKQEIIDYICIEIQKDPFNILKFNPKILTNLTIRDMVSKRNASLFAKDFTQEDQEKIITRYVVMAPYIKNITSKTLLSIVKIHADTHQSPQSLEVSLFYRNKDKVNEWSSDERMLAISKWPEVIGLFENVQFSEIVLAISIKGCLITNEDLPTGKHINNPFLRLLALKDYPYSIISLPNPTLEELRIVFMMEKSDHSGLLKNLQKLPDEIIDICLERNVLRVLENYPQTVDLCLKALKMNPKCWTLITIAQGSSFEEVLKYLNEKKNIINLIGE